MTEALAAVDNQLRMIEMLMTGAHSPLREASIKAHLATARDILAGKESS